MNIANVMDEIGTALGAIDGLRVFAYSADRITPPAAVVELPDPITYDETLGRGADRLTMLITVVVGRFDARTARDLLAVYLDGSAATSIKAAVDGGTYTACDSVRVTEARPDSYTIGGTTYLGAEFQLDIIGQGA